MKRKAKDDPEPERVRDRKNGEWRTFDTTRRHDRAVEAIRRAKDRLRPRRSR